MLTAGFAAGEQPVFASERDGANHIFRRIVVNVQFRIFQKHRELLFQLQGVIYRIVQRG